MSGQQTEPQSTETAAAEGATAPKDALSALVRSLDTSDRISLAAVGTAAVALIVGIVQTGFMWASRNDEVEAALRAEQVRACVAYRIAALDANERAQMIAVDAEAPDDKDAEEFERLLTRYRTTIGELSYLLPQEDDNGLGDVEAGAVDAHNAFIEEDFATLAVVSRADSAWARGHERVLEACEAVIRDVRDR